MNEQTGVFMPPPVVWLTAQQFDVAHTERRSTTGRAPTCCLWAKPMIDLVAVYRYGTYEAGLAVSMDEAGVYINVHGAWHFLQAESLDGLVEHGTILTGL
jgi:hypothetical protein